MKLFFTRMLPKTAIIKIKNGSVIALKVSTKNDGFDIVEMNDITESIAIELIRDKMVQAIKFYNRFNGIESMEIAYE